MKHTLGPWTARINQWSRWEILGGRGVLANIATPEDPASPPGDWRECEANARLTAAAPELLAILEKIVNNCFGDETSFHPVHGSFIGEARKLIAKATSPSED